MENEILVYFKAEKAESWLFIVVGALAIGFSIYAFFRMKESFYLGMMIPLILIALIQIVVGGTVGFRTEKQISELTTLYQTSPAEFKNQESKRMEIVNRNFLYYKYLEIAFIFFALLLLLFFKQNEFWLGLGVGLLFQASVMLCLDIVAERRAEIYVNAVQKIL